MNDNEIVCVENLHKWFGMLHVLKGVSFCVYPKEVLVIIGRSGSGKSTLLRCLNFLEEPSAGMINIAGQSMTITPGTKFDYKKAISMRLNTGMVFQEFNLFPHMTALDNVIEGLVTVKKMPKDKAIPIGIKYLQKVGLEGKKDQHPIRLSGGQKQRVAIARALAMEPKVMLFDEPTFFTKKFGTLVAVDRVNLEIEEGEFICFLGPSGCGKTTVLRMITGFETVTEGNVIFDGKVINDLIPQKREFGIVFQSYALFPNMTVEENIAFGLRVRKMPKKAIADRVDQMLDLIGLRDWRNLYPAQLSGGQQQRVALVRALAPNPQVLLLDEPLSALDAKIRVRLRAEVKRLQQELKKTMIYVTHDQEEALSIADRVVVMEMGQFRQVGKPIDIYKSPVSSFVADFVGTSNFFKGIRTDDRVRTEKREFRVSKSAPFSKEEVFLAIRPEKTEVFKYGEPPGHLDPSNLVAGRIDVVTFLGAAVRLVINMDGEEVISDVIEKEFEQRQLKQGDEVLLYFPPDAFIVYPAKEGS